VRTQFAGQARDGLLQELLPPLIEMPQHIRGFWLVDVLLRWVRAISGDSVGEAMKDTAGAKSLGELEGHWKTERATQERSTAPATLARLGEGPTVTTNDHVPSSMEPYQHSQDILFPA